MGYKQHLFLYHQLILNMIQNIFGYYGFLPIILHYLRFCLPLQLLQYFHIIVWLNILYEQFWQWKEYLFLKVYFNPFTIYLFVIYYLKS